jgi:hypothetical protein
MTICSAYRYICRIYPWSPDATCSMRSSRVLCSSSGHHTVAHVTRAQEGPCAGHTSRVFARNFRRSHCLPLCCRHACCEVWFQVTSTEQYSALALLQRIALAGRYRLHSVLLLSDLMCSVWQDAELSGSWTCIGRRRVQRSLPAIRSDRISRDSRCVQGHSWRSRCRNLILLL